MVKNVQIAYPIILKKMVFIEENKVINAYHVLNRFRMKKEKEF
jgi:hypothetical protein